MTDRHPFVPSTDQLHAFVDGHLDPQTHAAVAAYLAKNAELAAEVNGWRAQNEAIRQAFTIDPQDRDLTGFTLPEATPRQRPPVWRMAAAIALALIVGTGAGYGLRTGPLAPTARPLIAATDFANTATDAYLVYASEVRHPVDVPAADQKHLVAWLSKRLDTPLSVPDLEPSGFALVGGSLLPVTGTAGAMLMYQNDGGERLTLLVGRDPGNTNTAFRFTAADGANTFYWIDSGYGYALTGAIDRTQLETLAGLVHAQI